MNDVLLPLAAVLERVGVCKGTVYSWMRRGEFPRPLRVGPNSVRWSSLEVERWIAGRQRAGGRDDSGADW